MLYMTHFTKHASNWRRLMFNADFQSKPCTDPTSIHAGRLAGAFDGLART